jgi:ribonucleoside-diphosphate reductase alpha chain
MADNISSGIEPVFAHSMERTIQTYEGAVIEQLSDYGVREWVNYGKTAGECTLDEHLSVLDVSSKYMDSAVSKTINIGDKVTFDEFKDVYWKAYNSHAKGCTTFRASGKRLGILAVSAPEEGEGAACYFDPNTGVKTCE